MEHLRRYYRKQSVIYDATRWAFLFGRNRLLREVAKIYSSPRHVTEVGCGTGHNLVRLAKVFPEARITGVDLSEKMLALAAKKTAPFGERVALKQKVQDEEFHDPCDVIVFSYSLSMMNPGWDDVLKGAVRGLKPNGILAAVDFHDSSFGWFKTHMTRHHVRMDGHLLPVLADSCLPEVKEVEEAFRGLWTYFVFIGRKTGSGPLIPARVDSR